MKKIILLFSFLFFAIAFTTAQSKADLHPCGTPHGKSKWLTKYQQNPAQYDTKASFILYVPLTIHILGSDSGDGYFSTRSILDALCRLNTDFEAAEIQFYVQGDFNYINNSAWSSHDTVLEGAEMMFANNVENTINCYIVSDAAGNCGYNLPYAGIALSKNCTGPNDHTWAHEMGHNLSLPHPFLGWEGGQGYDGTMPAQYGMPAPLTVLYDYTFFKDTLILDTLIIDTAYVEYVERINCEVAADGFCDTEADYLNYRWNCNAENFSTVPQHDPDDVAFYSDGSLFMSYSLDDCQSRFSDEQIAAMRANLIDEKPELLANQTPGAMITDLISNQSPANSEVEHFETPTLSWDAVPNAEAYYVRLGLVFNGALIPIDQTTTAETTWTLEEDLIVGMTYEWTVRPFNAYDYCEENTAPIQFVAEETTNVKRLEGLTSLAIFPTILTSDAAMLNIHLTMDKALNVNLLLTNVAGQAVQNINHRTGEGKNEIQLSTADLAAGIYYLTISDGVGQVTRRVVVQSK